MILSNETDIKRADEHYMPVYLGYFFVALSIGSWEVLLAVFILIGIFVYVSRAANYNPIFPIIGYRYYEISSPKQVARLLITKQEISDVNNQRLKVRRINDYTFIEYDGGNNDE